MHPMSMETNPFAYCAFQNHANSEVKNFNQQLRFSLPSIKFPAVSEFRWCTKVAIKYQARGQCSMVDFLQSQSPVDDFSQDYEEVSVDIDLPDTEETQIVDSEEDQLSLCHSPGIL